MTALSQEAAEYLERIAADYIAADHGERLRDNIVNNLAEVADTEGDNHGFF